MTFFQALLLGLIQGLTEFLPVSSSGHLVIMQNLLGVEGQALTFDVFVHLGTFFSVLYIFRDDVFDLILNFPRTLKQILLIVVAIIPAGLAGILFKDFFAAIFTSGVIVGWMLLITGFFLFYAEHKTKSQQGKENINFFDAILVGLAQSLAILPGISRSGSTLSMGLLRGMERKAAARFSFLISLPTIGGAALLEGIDAINSQEVINWGLIFTGTLVAFISGIFAIKVLLKFLEEGRLKNFAFYCWIVGTITITLNFLT